MIEDEKKLNLSTLIDINFLQEFQDAFANTMKITIATFDDKGLLTKPSNYQNFCAKFDKKLTEGEKLCNYCDIKHIKPPKIKNGPVIIDCVLGLKIFAIPIIVASRQIGTILAGQIFTEKQDKKRLKEIAKELGYNEKEFINALEEIKVIPNEVLEPSIQLLSLASNTISQIAYMRFEEFEKVKTQNLYKNIIEAIRSSLDVNTTKQAVVDSVGKALNADRCFLMEFDKENNKFFNVEQEYLSSSNIPSVIGVDINEFISIPEVAAGFKEGKIFIWNEKRIQLGEEKFNLGDIDTKALENANLIAEIYKLKSILIFPLYYLDEFLGDLVVHYIEEKHDIGDEEINIMNLISDQIAIAMHQARLYKITEMQGQREKINRTIIEILSSSLDKNIIKNLFVKNIGRYFNADRVFISEFDTENNTYLPVDKNSEYLSSAKEKSFVDYVWSDTPVKEHFYPLIEKRELNIPDWDEYIKNNPMSQEVILMYQNANIKSSYNMPILYQQIIMGYLCIDFTQKVNKLERDDINLIRSICRQAGMALYHAQLYRKAQESIKIKEEFIYKIFEEIEKPLDTLVDCNKQYEYLDKINENIKKLLDKIE